MTANSFNISKKTGLIVIIVLTRLLSYAQIETQVINYKNRVEVSLEREIAVNPFSDKINQVMVIDARDDTMGIGYYSKPKGKTLSPVVNTTAYGTSSNKSWPKVYNMPSLKDSVSTWINNYLYCKKNGSAENNLLVVIKKLWLSDEAAPVLFENGKRGKPMDGWDPGIVCKFEFYLEKDSTFYPLYRFDSIFTFKDKLPDFAGSFITTALKSSLVKLYNINLTEVPAKRRKLTFSEIYHDYAKRSLIPVLQNPVIKKGVYMNFDEFKRNSPSIENFEFEKSEMGDLLYVTEKNSKYNARNAWGYCDGTNFFINSSDKYSKLIKRGNTFYFTGIKGIVRKAMHDPLFSSGLNYATNTGRKTTSYKGVLKYYQIDMETGEPY